jgi:hypothetical protein
MADERTTPRKGLVFLDFDDVFCLNTHYGGYDVALPQRPADFYDLLFAASCVAVLRSIDEKHVLQYVITTSWLRFFDREALTALLANCGIQFVVDRLHPQWEAPQNSRETRASAIEHWLSQHHSGEPFVVLDDVLSGTGIKESKVLSQRTVLCEANTGLVTAHIERVSEILSRPARSWKKRPGGAQ